MAYVGNQPAKGQFRKLSDISGSFDGVTTTFTTSVPPGTSAYYVTAGSASQLLVSLGGVIQQPDTDYTVSTNSITFTTAPAAGLDFFGVLMGDALNAGTPSDGSVTTAKLAGSLSVGLAAGSDSTPSLFFTGDVNNGIFSPGTDQLAVTTNGVERVEFGTSEVVFNDSGANYDFRVEGDTNANLFFVDASADAVGIGTSSPSSTLTVNSGSAATNLRLIGTGSGTDFRVDSPVSDYILQSGDGGFGGSNGFHFYNVNTSAYRMSLTNDGKLGIGTTSPAHKLVISNGGVENIEFNWDSVGSSNYIQSYNRSTSAYLPFTYYASEHKFHYAQSQFEAARIDTSGRLLVGTSTARANFENSTLSANFQIEGTDYATSRLSVVRNGGGGGINLCGTGGASVGSTTAVSSGSGLGELAFQGSDGTEFVVAASIQAFVDGTPGANDMPGRLAFSTTADSAASPTERMRILNNGLHRMLSSAAPTLEVRNTLSGSGDPLFQVAAGVTDMSAGGSVVMRIMGDGDVENATGVYTNPVSDERFKTDIVDVGSQWDDIKNVKLKKFRYKNNPDGELQLGIIAQELEPVCPNLIKRKIAGPEEVVASAGAVQEGEEYLSWKASLLPLKAVKALQEAMERIETLEAEVAALKGA